MYVNTCTLTHAQYGISVHIHVCILTHAQYVSIIIPNYMYVYILTPCFYLYIEMQRVLCYTEERSLQVQMHENAVETTLQLSLTDPRQAPNVGKRSDQMIRARRNARPAMTIQSLLASLRGKRHPPTALQDTGEESLVQETRRKGLPLPAHRDRVRGSTSMRAPRERAVSDHRLHGPAESENTTPSARPPLVLRNTAAAVGLRL